MSEELVFTVVGSEAVAATPITLAEAGLRERQHLQEWVLANPEILGREVLIITSEFDRWESRGGAERDRLDILGLASDGHLVVAELKRDVAPDTVEMQAIKYAAMASRFDSDVLADAYVEFQRRQRDETLTSEEALELLAAHAELGLSDESLRAPRIVLVATQLPSRGNHPPVYDLDATGPEGLFKPGRDVLVGPRHDPARVLEQRDLTAEVGKDRGELASRVHSADNCDTVGQRTQSPYVLEGQGQLAPGIGGREARPPTAMMIRSALHARPSAAATVRG